MRLEFNHARRHEGRRRDLHRFGVAFAFDRIVTKQTIQQLLIVERRGGSGACKKRRGLDLKLEFVGCGFQAVCLLINRIAERLGTFGIFFLRLLLFPFLLDLGAHLFKRLDLRSFNAHQLDDVQAEIGFDQPGNFAFLQFECGVFKRLDHRAAAKHAEITALRCRPRVL